MKDINPYPFEGTARFNHSVWPWQVSTDCFSHVMGEPLWCVLHDATGGYVSDACVEGTGTEFLALAAALRREEDESFKRCAIEFCGNELTLWSPRNCHGGCASLKREQAAELADIIECAVRKAMMEMKA